MEINNLPDDILMQIFSSLDFETHLKSALVCRRWSRLLKRSGSRIKCLGEVEIVDHFIWIRILVIAIL
ncbi:F-box/kelch-repeat protein [Trichinella spiralis]|uniref:F-box/kelch-repeat protein n=1 Tax=Trichinella spiralis TaxID=6334 RepID=A0ABR3KMY0_TRISP